MPIMYVRINIVLYVNYNAVPRIRNHKSDSQAQSPQVDKSWGLQPINQEARPPGLLEWGLLGSPAYPYGGGDYSAAAVVSVSEPANTLSSSSSEFTAGFLDFACFSASRRSMIGFSLEFPRKTIFCSCEVVFSVSFTTWISLPDSSANAFARMLAPVYADASR